MTVCYNEKAFRYVEIKEFIKGASMKTDTITAIATAMTNSGIGIVRISGEESFTIIDKIYRSKKGDKKLSQQKSHTVHYGYICDGEKIIDEVMVLIMKAPNSYTAEDLSLIHISEPTRH